MSTPQTDNSTQKPRLDELEALSIRLAATADEIVYLQTRATENGKAAVKWKDKFEKLQSERDLLLAQVAELQSRFNKQNDYAIALQRVIEHVCDGKPLPDWLAKDTPHHAQMIQKKLYASPWRPISEPPTESESAPWFGEVVVLDDHGDIWTVNRSEVHGGQRTDGGTYPLVAWMCPPPAPVFEAAPADPYASLKAAHAAGKVIQCLDSGPEPKFFTITEPAWDHPLGPSAYRAVDPTPDWSPKFRVGDWVAYETVDGNGFGQVVKVNPDDACHYTLSGVSGQWNESELTWTLPPLPPGLQYHKPEFFNQSNLLPGERPATIGEQIQEGDYFFDKEHNTWRLYSKMSPDTVVQACYIPICTSRPFPEPQPEPEMVDLEACDVPPGSVFKSPDGPAYMAVCVDESKVHFCNYGLGNMARTFHRLRANGWLISRDNGRTWERCEKMNDKTEQRP